MNLFFDISSQLWEAICMTVVFSWEDTEQVARLTTSSDGYSLYYSFLLYPRATEEIVAILIVTCVYHMIHLVSF